MQFYGNGIWYMVLLMVTVNEAIIARLDKDGKHFEVLVDPELAYALKEGKTVSIQKMLAVNQIFKDAKKGERASESEIISVFNIDDVELIATAIVKKGDIQLTTEFRRKKTEERKRQVASFISKYAINPQTKVPHPLERILNAMDQAHVHVDPFRPAEQQVEETAKAISSVLPISLEETTITVDIPARYAGRAYGIIKELGELQDQKWLNDGSLHVKIKIPSGMKESVFSKINALTEGNARILGG